MATKQTFPFNTLVQTLRATHFVPSIVVTTMATALAYGAGQRSSLLLFIPAVLFGQFCIGWTNDYLDRSRDRKAGRQEKPIVSGAVSASTVRMLAVISLAAALAFSLLYNDAATVVYVIALASALLYNFKLKNSPLSVASYMVSFGLLPYFVSFGSQPPFMPNVWIVIALLFWAVGIHIQNVIPDFEHDKKTGVNGMVNRLSLMNATLLSALFFALCVVSLVVLLSPHIPSIALVIIGVFICAFVVLIQFVRNKQFASSYNLGMFLTGCTTVLIMLSGPYIR